MTSAQKQAFLQLIGEYGKLENDEDARSRMAELEANLDETYFAWYGPTTEGSAAYFRVTGPTIVGRTAASPHHLTRVRWHWTPYFGASFGQDRGVRSFGGGEPDGAAGRDGPGPVFGPGHR